METKLYRDPDFTSRFDFASHLKQTRNYIIIVLHEKD